MVNALSSSLVVRDGHPYLMVEAACPAESWIQCVWTVCCSNDHDGLVVCFIP
jgi:hypothetical protein